MIDNQELVLNEKPIDVAEDIAEFETVDLPKIHYHISTGHGSTFYCEFLPTMRMFLPDGEACLVGEMFIKGFAIATGEDLMFTGMGWLPELGGHITVAPYRLLETGDSEVRDYELITEITELSPDEL